VGLKYAQVLLLAGVFLPVIPDVAAAQYVGPQPPAAGKFLVATDKLGDPNFSESVVLVTQYSPDDGTIGLVVNRRTDVPLSRVFPKKGATEDPVFAGGPVDIRLVQALVRKSAKPNHSTHLVEDVYAVASKEEIEKSIAARVEPSKFRAYLGYAGWGPSQLEQEIEIGAWSVLNAAPKMIFDEDPDSLWERLNRLAHSQIASLDDGAEWEAFSSHQRRVQRPLAAAALCALASNVRPRQSQALASLRGLPIELRLHCPRSQRSYGSENASSPPRR
jgi:putative transcriptional regulator